MVRQTMIRQPGMSRDFGRHGLVDIAGTPPEWIKFLSDPVIRMAKCSSNRNPVELLDIPMVCIALLRW
jgi:hypothetical protein